MKKYVEINLRPDTFWCYTYDNSIFLYKILSMNYFICASISRIGRYEILNLKRKTKKEKEQILSILN